jgi:glycine/D-amino acid oxidase-like deaminating enzyme
MLSVWEQHELLHADVVIVGGGVVGMWSALEIARRHPRLRILLLERAPIPLGASTRNAGFATIGTVGEAIEHARSAGTERVAMLIVERWLGIRRWLEEFDPEELGYEPVGGYELIRPHEEHVRHAVDYWNELLRDSFGGDVFADRPELVAEFGFPREQVQTILATPYDGALHTGRAIRALQLRIARMGIWTMSGARAEALEPASSGVTLTCWDSAAQRTLTLRARVVALCTNAWLPELVPNLEIRPARGQVLLSIPLGRQLWRGTFHMEAGFYYFRALGTRLLLGGGRHRAMQEEETYEFALNPFVQKHLEELARSLLPPDVEFAVQTRWCGIMGMAPDRLPRVQHVGERTVVGFGCNGMGMALAPRIGAQVATLVEEWLAA